jgi:RNA polymerase sigma-70 factor (ECF subfamily)
MGARTNPLSETSSTSTSLLARVRAQEPDAWVRLLQLYGPLVYSWSRQGGLQPADAADVVQEVFRAVHVALPNFQREQSGDSFRGWLRVISQNKLYDHFRRRGRSPQPLDHSGGVHPAAASDTSEATSTPAAEHVQLVRRALSLVRTEFTEATWQAFWLTAIEGLSAADAGAKLSLTAGAVRQAKYKVLRRLRSELSELQ